MDKLLKFLMWTVGIFAGLCILARLLLFETWKIPEESILSASAGPTLKGGDLVLVLVRGESTFGDLVRCPDPEDASSFVVGRIAGMGGDEIDLAGRVLRVNGTRYDSSDACTQQRFEVIHPDTGNPVEMKCGRVEMGGGWHFRGTGAPSTGNNDKKAVGTGRVYLLSDNRDLHDDSRDFGTLPAETCNQRIVFRLWGADGWTNSEDRLTLIR